MREVLCLDCVLYGIICRSEGEKTRKMIKVFRTPVVVSGKLNKCPIKLGVNSGESRILQLKKHKFVK